MPELKDVSFGAQDGESSALASPAPEQPPTAAPSGEHLTSGPPNPGWFRRGEPGPALRHGGRSQLVAAGLLPEQADARAALAEREAAIMNDLGGAAELSTLAAGMVERHARLEMVESYLFTTLQQLGPLTAKGRTRAALTAWLSVVDRLQKSALALGLARRTRQVTDLARALSGLDGPR